MTRSIRQYVVFFISGYFWVFKKILMKISLESRQNSVRDIECFRSDQSHIRFDSVVDSPFLHILQVIIIEDDLGFKIEVFISALHFPWSYLDLFFMESSRKSVIICFPICCFKYTIFWDFNLFQLTDFVGFISSRDSFDSSDLPDFTGSSFEYGH